MSPVGGLHLWSWTSPSQVWVTKVGAGHGARSVSGDPQKPRPALSCSLCKSLEPPTFVFYLFLPSSRTMFEMYTSNGFFLWTSAAFSLQAGPRTRPQSSTTALSCDSIKHDQRGVYTHTQLHFVTSSLSHKHSLTYKQDFCTNKLMTQLTTTEGARQVEDTRRRETCRLMVYCSLKPHQRCPSEDVSVRMSQ